MVKEPSITFRPGIRLFSPELCSPPGRAAMGIPAEIEM
jgi:hypothetical protein